MLKGLSSKVTNRGYMCLVLINPQDEVYGCNRKYLFQAVAWQIAIFVNLNLNEFLKICILSLFQFV